MEISNYTKNKSNDYKKYRKPIGINTIIDNIKNIFGDRTNLKILDCGCGCGNYSEILNKYGYSITAIDFNDSMLNILEEKKLNNVETMKVNLKEFLPFDNHIFDVVIINQVMHHFGDKDIDYYYHQKLIDEFSRILKKMDILV